MIFGISDLHLDITTAKDMSVFGENWANYEDRIFKAWQEQVSDEDLVLVPGDISWAMDLQEAVRDLDRIEDLPGIKVMIKGNHDYWWASIGKIRKLGYRTIHFLQNDSFVYNRVGIFGSRGWINPDASGFTDHDLSVYQRELQRLELSFAHLRRDELKHVIAMTHYPPFDKEGKPNDIGKRVIGYHADFCVYGHLHSTGLMQVVEGQFEDTEFVCLSADYLDFKPRPILKEGRDE